MSISEADRDDDQRVMPVRQRRSMERQQAILRAGRKLLHNVPFDALRMEQIAQEAGCSVGTLYQRFKDKDALMDRIIGGRIDALLDDLEGEPLPGTPTEMAEALMPLCEFMTCERYVFDLIMRHSGAAAIAEIGPIAETFGRQVEIFESWLARRPFRMDISANLQAEGVHAFLLQAMAVKFCALHNATSIRDRLAPYLEAWLNPSVAG